MHWLAIRIIIPANKDKLDSEGFRFVEEVNFFKEKEIVKGKIKVTSVPGFHGVFKDSKNNAIDLRPPLFKVSYKNLMQKEIKDLAFIFDSALLGQIRTLKNTPNYNKNLFYQLRKFIKKFRKSYQKFLDL